MGKSQKLSMFVVLILIVLINFCESGLLERVQLPLGKTLGNTTKGLQHTVDNLLTFDMFKEVFKKTYATADAEQKALENFLFNQKDINRHNAEFAAGRVPYLRGLWDYSDLSSEEVNKYMNGFKRPVTTRVATDTLDETNPPDSVNWVKKGFVTNVQKQGLCGSCWSFSSSGAIEAQIFKKTGKLQALSKQNLIDCNYDEIDGNYGCGGGDMIQAFSFVVDQKGIALEEMYPYEATDKLQCRYSKAQSGGAISSYVSLSPCSEDSLKASLAKYGPIALAVDASLATFQSYRTGVYFDSECTSDINHAVLLVGYGTDEKTGEKYWLVKNSYGESWGENGYIRIRRDANNQCGVTEFAVVPVD